MNPQYLSVDTYTMSTVMYNNSGNPESGDVVSAESSVLRSFFWALWTWGASGKDENRAADLHSW